MQCTPKFIAIASSAALLVGGSAIAFAVTSAQSPQTAAPAVAVTPQTTEVLVWADGATQRVAIAQPTVAAALSAASVALGEHDRVLPSLGSQLAAGDSVKVSRVTVTQETKRVTLAFASQQVQDATLEKGTNKVKTKGVAGVREDLVATTMVDGLVEGTEVVSRNVLREPVNQVTAVGTKKPAVISRPAPGGAIDMRRSAMWDRIAKCESTNRWNVSTGNGYYGGLQFSLSTWRSVGGTDFAAYPHQASREQQITVANRLYDKRGLGPWGCKG